MNSVRNTNIQANRMYTATEILLTLDSKAT